MSDSIELTADLTVDIVDFMGTDLTIVNAARVSFAQHSEELSEKDKGLINFLMKNKHTSPFEHCQASFLITCPIFVVREWHRHRTQSYNEVSGRYTELQPKFYAPDLMRPLIQTGKPGDYHFELPEDDSLYYEIWREVRFTAQTAWNTYQTLLAKGVAKEVARIVLPNNIYTSYYASANLLNWMRFLSSRTEIHAMYEIRQLAYQVEAHLTERFPIAMNTWEKNGRVI